MSSSGPLLAGEGALSIEVNEALLTPDAFTQEKAPCQYLERQGLLCQLLHQHYYLCAQSVSVRTNM